MSSIATLLSVFAAYREATGLAEATISTKFLGRGSRLAELIAGGDMGSRRIEAALLMLSEHWPENAVWPPDAPRPGSTTETPPPPFPAATLAPAGA